ncbi:MAG: hypothetical protein JJ920_09585 [Roseitalea sp.]|jgi:hypothetical protein|nr:hypothetical protein [Roseitalea sp.]MBO6720846.1 hypothetical protein [Roseitalea sp.]MBO6743151.1 hypothetical protein [Roseitalea sp.]
MKMRTLILSAAALAVVAVAGMIAYNAHSTRAAITKLEQTVIDRTTGTPAPWTETLPDTLPEPVARYFAYVFPDGPPDHAFVEIEAAGQFRRPLTETFQPTTARQVISLRAPDLVFSADTPLWGPVWAIAYDAYIDGQMEMAAKLLSTVTVMHETSTPALNRISLRRWLLESPAYPMALLPGGPVTWEAIDDNRARAIVRAFGEEASLVATFDADGALTRFDAETDGDLTTPYHGSGEHTARSDYRLIDGVRVPFAFTIARAAGGEILPFWEGRITAIRFGGS